MSSVASDIDPVRHVEPASAVENAMTIDVEDYFHVSVFDGVVPRDRWTQLESRVVDNTDRLLRLFSDEHVTATFFILGCVAERVPSLVSRIASMGHEVASHGYAHRLIYDQAPAAFRDDVRRSKDLLESMTGRPVEGFRAPSYSITPQTLWALDVLIDEGFTYDASIFPIRHDRYGIPSSPRHPYVLSRAGGSIVEAPASTIRLGRTNLPDRRRRIFSDPAVCVDALGHRARSIASSDSRRSSICIRGNSIRISLVSRRVWSAAFGITTTSAGPRVAFASCFVTSSSRPCAASSPRRGQARRRIR